MPSLDMSISDTDRVDFIIIASGACQHDLLYDVLSSAADDDNGNHTSTYGAPAALSCLPS